MANAPMASHPVPHERHHPGIDHLVQDFGRTNLNPAHGQQSFARQEAPIYHGFLLTKSKTPGKTESWERVQKTVLPVTEDELMEEVKKEKRKGVSPLTVYDHPDMGGLKRTQVDQLIKDMIQRDSCYPAYDYKLVLLKLALGRNPKRQKVTVSMRIILKRQLATDDLHSRLHSSETVDVKKTENHFQTYPNVHGPPPPPIPSVRHVPQFDQYPENDHFAPQSGSYTPQSTPPSTPPSHGFIPPSDGFPMPQETFRPGSGHPKHPQDHQPYSQDDQQFEQEGFPYGGPPRQQPKTPENDGKAKAGKDGKGKAGDDKSKNPQFKKDKSDPQANSGPFESESDSSDGLQSDDSQYSGFGTNRTADTELSGRSKEKNYRSDKRDGHRSSHGSRERYHHEYEGGSRGDHTSRRRDNRNSRSSHDYEKDFTKGSTRQHRRKSPPFSSNSSSSSGYLKDEKMYIPHNSNSRRARRGSEYLSDELHEFDSPRNSYGSRYSNDEKSYVPFNSRRARRGSEYLSDERPSYGSHKSYEDSRLPRRPEYPGKRRTGYNPHRVELYDDRADITETVQAAVIDELRRENDRLRDGHHRPEPMINERERPTRGPGHPSAYSDLPRSRRLSADLQSTRYPY